MKLSDGKEKFPYIGMKMMRNGYPCRVIEKLENGWCKIEWISDDPRFQVWSELDVFFYEDSPHKMEVK